MKGVKEVEVEAGRSLFIENVLIEREWGGGLKMCSFYFP